MGRLVRALAALVSILFGLFCLILSYSRPNQNDVFGSRFGMSGRNIRLLTRVQKGLVGNGDGRETIFVSVPMSVVFTEKENRSIHFVSSEAVRNECVSLFFVKTCLKKITYRS